MAEVDRNNLNCWKNTFLSSVNTLREVSRIFYHLHSIKINNRCLSSPALEIRMANPQHWEALGRGCPVGRVLSSRPEGPGSRLSWRKTAKYANDIWCMKIRRGCNVLQVPIQILPLGVPKRGSHPLWGGSTLQWRVSGSSFGMNPRPSAISH